MKKQIGKRLLSIVLSLALIFTIMPIIPGAVDKVSAATNYITQVELNYDLSYIDLHTAWTKGEVNARVKSSMSTTTAGVAISDSSNSGLRYTPEGSSQMWGIGDGTGQIDSTSTYYIEYYLNPLNGYYWTVDTMKGNGLTVIANGENITSDVIFDYNVTWNGLSVYVPIGKASTKAKVTGVEIDGGDISLEKGGSFVFTGKVKGNVKDKLIIWSVEDNKSVNTKITSTGKLTIGEDETAEFINVVATANANILKRARVKVAVLDSAPTIYSITVTPNDSEVSQGRGNQFEAIVEGTQLDKRVTWSVEGALDAETTINENGYLKVGIDETAESIIVRATSYVNPAKSGIVTVKIVPLNKISKLELRYDFKHIDLNTAWTEGEVDDRVLSCIATTTEGVVVSISSNSGLSYIPEGSSTMHGISDGNGQVDVAKSYYIRYHLALASSDYEWITSAKDGNGTGLTVIVNGTDKTSDTIIQYNSYWNNMIVYVPLGNASDSPRVRNVTINERDVSVAAGESKKFTGNVSGTVRLRTISWSLIGNTSDDTVIDTNSGVLTVGEDETAETITVIAMSNADNSKYATVEVTITKKTEECKHIWDEGVETKAPTCAEEGEKTYTCTVFGCGEKKTESIAELGHSYSSSYTVDTKATTTADGSKSKHCTKSGCTAKSSVTAIPKISTVKLSTANYTYNGEAKKPSVTVKDSKGTALKNGTDYTVSYASGRTKIGKYKVTVTFKDSYSGSKALYFEVGPKNPSSVKSELYGYNDVKVSWSKVSGATGYKIYYKKASASSYTLLKTTTATSYKKANLDDGVKYDFKVVAYKTVNGNACENAGKTSSITTLKKIADVKAAKSGTKVKVSWTNIDGETGYQISQATSKTGTKVVATYKTTSGKYKTVSATKGKTYYYKVRAYKVVGKTKIYGPWSSVVKYKR